ncbi:MAG: peptidoglycan DD-metalloendopeptidase family protein [Alphaproteobacteria bacterium]|nr:peptidoglycan DD-metalloendopeptidase family protein [Alphaproteobacteria bacterium]
MRHILLAAAAIGAAASVALGIPTRPIIDFDNNPKALSTSYATQAGPDTGSATADAPAREALIPATQAPAGDAAAAPDADETASAESGTPRQRIEKVRRGDTLMTLLARAGVVGTEAHDAVKALKTVFNPRNLKIGQEIKLTFAPSQDEDGQDLHSLSLQASVEKDVAVKRTDGGDFQSEQTGRVLTQSLGRSGSLIERSLFKAGTDAGVPVEVMFELIRAFSYDVDFQRDIQPGDSFEVLFEQTHDANGRLVRTGRMMYAALSLSGNLLELYRYEPKDGGPQDYFNPKGESVKKALLRTPVDGAKLTSGFGMRSHPILGYTRMHRGLDFGVPSGTPIMAAGDGVVELAGANGGYGNYVRIRHGSSYATAYAHMSRFGPGIKKGTVVRQGQIVGYVGATGLATGPHLHYEVLVNDHQINPMSVKMPAGRQLAGAELKRFNGAMGEIERKLRALPDPFTVASAK